eukprot:Gb_05186 [translate_table: standard]
MIKPSSATPPDKHVLHLSYLEDQLRLFVSQLYFYTIIPSDEDISCLKSSLSKVLTYFYPLPGRIAKTETGNIYVDCNDQGVLFYEAEVDANYKYIDFHEDVNLIDTLLPPESSGQCSMAGAPMLLIQVNRFKCGSVALATVFHHSIADADAFIHFMNSWSEVARGQRVSILPWFDRSFLPRNNEVTAACNAEFVKHTISVESTIRKIFRFNKQSIDALKKLASAVGNGEPTRTPTSVECVSALLWRCISRARGFGADEKTMVGHAVNLRKRMKPPVKEGFFGNAILGVSIVEKVGDVIGELPGYLENRFHLAISEVDDDFIESSVQSIERQTSQCFSFISNSSHVAISSWWRFPMYETDFGWRKPHWITANVDALTSLVILLGVRSGSGMEAIVSIEKEYMSKLEQDPEFLSFACVP